MGKNKSVGWAITRLKTSEFPVVDIRASIQYFWWDNQWYIGIGSSNT